MSRYLVTGVSRGIGSAVAAQLLGSGHEVIGVVRPGRGDSVRDLALAACWELDLVDPVSFRQRLADELPLLERLDGLVHCAGIVRSGSLSEPLTTDLAEQLTVNVTAVAELTRLLLPALRAGHGTIVLVNSGSGLNARPPLSGYGISKHALRGYADALRHEEPDVRVSSVFPGPTATDMQREVQSAVRGEYRAEDYLEPTTVAAAICFVLGLPPDGVITDLTVRPH